MYNLYLHFLSFFLRHFYDSRLKNKRFRQRYRRFKKRDWTTKKIKALKWGVSYSVFDGEELLEASIKNIRPAVDYVQVCYQLVSWHGNPANKTLLPLLKQLKQKGLIDDLIEFKPNLKLRPWKNELNKRNFGLKIAKQHKVNYFMTMDTDEFYHTDSLEQIKKEIVQNGITHLFCAIKAYNKNPLEQHVFPSYFVQIFSKVKFFSKLCNNKRAPCLVDPTRKLSHFMGAKYYVTNKICMHHFSSIRKNLEIKYKNSSGYNLKYRNCDYILVPDTFNLLPIIKGWKNNGK